MKEERMKILQMIENGIINAKEGVELLAVLKEGETARDKFDNAVRKTGEFANCAKDKICEFAKEKEPVVKETVGNIAAMAGGFAEGVGKAIKSYVDKNDNPAEEKEPKTEENSQDDDNDVIDI
jgi:hypothetical protein